MFLDAFIVLVAALVPAALARRTEAFERTPHAPYVAAAGGLLLASAFVPWVTVGEYAWELQGGFTIIAGQGTPDAGPFFGSYNSTVLNASTGTALLVFAFTGHDRALHAALLVAAAPVLAAAGDLVTVLTTGTVDDVHVLRLTGNDVRELMLDDVTVTLHVGVLAATAAAIPLAVALTRTGRPWSRFR